MGRKPVPDDQKRSDRITTRVRPDAGERFRKLCHDLDLSEAEGAREALKLWIERMEKR